MTQIAGERSIWKPQYLHAGVPSSIAAGPGWYGSRTIHLKSSGLIGETWGPFASEAECDQWCQQKNSVESTNPATLASGDDHA